MKIGLIGEDPNDTSSIEFLLSQKYKDLKFTPVLRDLTGSNLDVLDRVMRLLRIELLSKSFDFIIYIRDLDKMSYKADRINWFKSLNTVTNNTGIYLLNIHEIESLILADIECFNKHFKVNAQCKVDPTTIEKPKEELEKYTKEFKRSSNKELFKKLDIVKLREKCNYFDIFIKELELKIASSTPKKKKDKVEKTSKVKVISKSKLDKIQKIIKDKN